MDLVLLGAPGSGKGTQADHLRRALGLTHVASGDLFRDLQRPTPNGELRTDEAWELGVKAPAPGWALGSWEFEVEVDRLE